MNILEKLYPEISIKTDAEDLKVMIDYINQCGEILRPEYNKIQVKASVSLLKEIRDKFAVKHYHKKGTTKQFLVKLKVYQLVVLMEVFVFNDVINSNKPFEKNTIMKYNNLFHQKLTGL